jgi:hypothetical protein
MVNFVMVEDAEGVPLRRVSRHVGRDVRAVCELILILLTKNYVSIAKLLSIS